MIGFEKIRIKNQENQKLQSINEMFYDGFGEIKILSLLYNQKIYNQILFFKL